MKENFPAVTQKGRFFTRVFLLPLFFLMTLGAGAALASDATEDDETAEWPVSAILKECQRRLGAKPIGFYANFAPYTPTLRSKPILFWAVSDHNAVRRSKLLPGTKMRTVSVPTRKLSQLNAVLNGPEIDRMLQNLPTRERISPDAPYWILGAKVHGTWVILEYSPAGKRMDLVDCSDPEVKPLAECWAAMTDAFDPVFSKEKRKR